MTLDRRDIEMLRLAAMYRWLPLGVINKLGFTGISDEVGLLSAAGLVKTSRDMKYVRLSEQGCALLRRHER